MARAEPGKLNWAGVTGALDFVFAGWLKQWRPQHDKVPYRNPVDAANDLAEGRVQVYERRWRSCGRSSKPARSSCSR